MSIWAPDQTVAYQVVAEEAHLPQQVEDGAVAHPLPQGGELALDPGPDVHHPRARQREVLQLFVRCCFFGHHDVETVEIESKGEILSKVFESGSSHLSCKR